MGLKPRGHFQKRRKKYQEEELSVHKHEWIESNSKELITKIKADKAAGRLAQISADKGRKAEERNV